MGLSALWRELRDGRRGADARGEVWEADGVIGLIIWTLVAVALYQGARHAWSINYRLPDGYGIATAGREGFEQLVLWHGDERVTESSYIHIYGYGECSRKLVRAAHSHRRTCRAREGA